MGDLRALRTGQPARPTPCHIITHRTAHIITCRTAHIITYRTARPLLEVHDATSLFAAVRRDGRDVASSCTETRNRRSGPARSVSGLVVPTGSRVLVPHGR